MQHQIAEQLAAHVLWIGGSPCAGKTSIADALAARYHGIAYHFDRMERDHIMRSDATTNPELMAFLALTMDERWLTRSPGVMARNAIASWKARFPLVLEDLRALPGDVLIFAEGPGLFPSCVAPLLSGERQAIWLVTTEPMCMAIRRARGGSSLETSDPERALRNIVQLDLLMARYVKMEAATRHLTVYEVDGQRSMEPMTRLVEQHFAPCLPERQREEHDI